MTVAVLGAVVHTLIDPLLLRERKHFAFEWYSGSGAGGQHRNKSDCCLKLTHLPTGSVRTAQTRSRANSEALAMKVLLADLDLAINVRTGAARNAVRRTQIGDGQRSSGRERTFRFRQDLVLDHTSNRRASCSEVMTGRFDRLWG